MQIKTQKHEEIIRYNLLESSEPYRRWSRGNLRVCIRKTSMFGKVELRSLLETPKLILTFIQTIDIGLKQRLMKK